MHALINSIGIEFTKIIFPKREVLKKNLIIK